MRKYVPRNEWIKLNTPLHHRSKQNVECRRAHEQNTESASCKRFVEAVKSRARIFLRQRPTNTKWWNGLIKSLNYEMAPNQCKSYTVAFWSHRNSWSSNHFSHWIIQKNRLRLQIRSVKNCRHEEYRVGHTRSSAPTAHSVRNKIPVQ